ncbi:DNA polymerase III subunit delta' [Shewanella sp. YIC-542]|uniref:DNA polymerase III subunit delta' n=1 Tax=Shewanella mytili TaxID=3377111 RepID=UPI00398ED91E
MPEELPWLQAAKQQFIQQRQQGNLPHALLLPLPEADGGVLLARFMAQQLLCAHPTASGACGHCKSCQLFAAATHPDFYQLQADGSQIKVEQVRHLCEALSTTPQQGGYRIALVLQCERMNTAAANALLKTLEEPGAATLLLLQSDHPGGLLATIVSRCQQIKVRRPSPEQLHLWLRQRHPQLNEPVAWCLPVAGGALKLAQYIEDGYFEELKKLKAAWQDSLTKGHLSQKLSHPKAEQLFDLLKLLYQVLMEQLQSASLDPLQQLRLTELATSVMRDNRQLMLMANVNYLALFQRYVLEYKRITR